MEAHNDEDGGNDDSKEVEESDVPIIGGIEFIVGVSTDFFILFVSSDAVIVLDNVKFDEILFETDVCDKSVGSVIKWNKHFRIWDVLVDSNSIMHWIIRLILPLTLLYMCIL